MAWILREVVTAQSRHVLLLTLTDSQQALQFMKDTKATDCQVRHDIPQPQAK